MLQEIVNDAFNRHLVKSAIGAGIVVITVVATMKAVELIQSIKTTKNSEPIVERVVEGVVNVD